jgi:hypothetical protein
VHSPIIVSLKTVILRPLGQLESVLLLLIATLSLIDAFTTVTMYVTGLGAELNPITDALLRVNPFLVYPFSLSFLLVILLFRFNSTAEYGVMLLLGTISMIASVNNMGVLFFDYSIAVRVFGGVVYTQFFAFILGVVGISGYSLFRSIHAREKRWRSIRGLGLSLGEYVVAYTLLSLMSVSWLILLR